jgi:hypothetical protein
MAGGSGWGGEVTEWHKIAERPEPGRSYLIRTEGAGPIYDVAFFNGKRPDGTDWWTLGDIQLSGRAVTHWAPITDP